MEVAEGVPGKGPGIGLLASGTGRAAGVYRRGMSVGTRPGSTPRVVEHLADTARARDDVVVRVEAALLVPTQARRRCEHVRRREAAVDARGIYDDPRIEREDGPEVLRRHDHRQEDPLVRL